MDFVTKDRERGKCDEKGVKLLPKDVGLSWKEGNSFPSQSEEGAMEKKKKAGLERRERRLGEKGGNRSRIMQSFRRKRNPFERRDGPGL